MLSVSLLRHARTAGEKHVLPLAWSLPLPAWPDLGGERSRCQAEAEEEGAAALLLSMIFKRQIPFLVKFFQLDHLGPFGR